MNYYNSFLHLKIHKSSQNENWILQKLQIGVNRSQNSPFSSYWWQKPLWHLMKCFSSISSNWCIACNLFLQRIKSYYALPKGAKTTVLLNLHAMNKNNKFSGFTCIPNCPQNMNHIFSEKGKWMHPIKCKLHQDKMVRAVVMHSSTKKGKWKFPRLKDLTKKGQRMGSVYLTFINQQIRFRCLWKSIHTRHSNIQ